MILKIARKIGGNLMSATVENRLWKSSVEYWNETNGTQRVLFISGTILFLSMIVHIGALIVSDRAFDGPISFRKAATFAETGWLMCWAVGWFLPMVPLKRGAQRFVVTAVLLFALGETLIMTLQVWRGVPSHYNTTTIFDSIWIGLGGVIALIFLVAMIVLLRAMLRQPFATPSIRSALIAGTVMMIIGSVTGFWMQLNSGGIWLGALQPMVFGGYFAINDPTLGGNLVVIHAVGVHGFQLVTLVAWLLTYTPLTEQRRLTITRLSSTASLLLLGLLLIQALTVRPLTDFSQPMWLAVSATLLVYVGTVLFSMMAAGLSMLRAAPTAAESYT